MTVPSPPPQWNSLRSLVSSNSTKIPFKKLLLGTLYKWNQTVFVCTSYIFVEQEMATHSSILVWKIPWTEQPGGLQSVESQSQTRLSTHTPVYWDTFLRLIYVLQTDCIFFSPSCSMQQVIIYICFIHSNVYMSILVSQFIPLFPHWCVYIYSLCVCIYFWFANRFICTIFSKFHIYTLMQDICFSLPKTYFTVNSSSTYMRYLEQLNSWSQKVH